MFGLYTLDLFTKTNLNKVYTITATTFWLVSINELSDSIRKRRIMQNGRGDGMRPGADMVHADIFFSGGAILRDL